MKNIWRMINTFSLHLTRNMHKYLSLDIIILFLETHSFPQATLLGNCLPVLLRTDFCGQIQCVCQHIFAPNGGYCLFIKYYQLNILCHPSQVDFPDCQASYSSFFFKPCVFFRTVWGTGSHLYLIVFYFYFLWKKIPQHVVSLSVSLGVMCMYSCAQHHTIICNWYNCRYIYLNNFRILTLA